MQILEDVPQATLSSGASAHALLKYARRHGRGCRMNVRATVRDLAEALQAGGTVLIHGNGTRDVFVVSAIEEGMVTLTDAHTGEESTLGLPQFGALWHGNREERTGRMMVVGV